MKQLIVDLVALIIIGIGSLMLLEPDIVYAQNSNSLNEAAMFGGDCDSDSTPCACGFIACTDAGGSTSACWAGYEGCIGCSPDTTCEE